MTNKTKRDIEKEERSRSIYMIKRDIQEMGREPVPGEIEKLMEERKGTKRSQNPVIEYYRFYQNRIIPNSPFIKDRIGKSKTNEIKMHTDDFAKRIAMTGINPYTIIEKTRPALLIEGISINIGDRGKLIIMKKATEKEKLTGQARSIADIVCKIDPQTDNPRILEFQKKICQLK